MITEEPHNWRDLQEKVNYILNGVGLNSETELTIKTPRGKVEVDVYARDENSVDRITYVIECKNWNKNVSQNVIHSFMTVMNETGVNIGYIISKKGFQTGAIDFIKYTNISLFSFEEFQNHYLQLWFERYFQNRVYEMSKKFLEYMDPFSIRKIESKDKLSKTKKDELLQLEDKNFNLSLTLMELAYLKRDFFNKFRKKEGINEVWNIDKIKDFFEMFNNMKIESSNFKELIDEIEYHVEKEIDKFIKIYGVDIF